MLTPTNDNTQKIDNINQTSIPGKITNKIENKTNSIAISTFELLKKAYKGFIALLPKKATLVQNSNAQTSSSHTNNFATHTLGISKPEKELKQSTKITATYSKTGATTDFEKKQTQLMNRFLAGFDESDINFRVVSFGSRGQIYPNKNSYSEAYIFKDKDGFHFKTSFEKSGNCQVKLGELELERNQTSPLRPGENRISITMGDQVTTITILIADSK